MMGASNSLESHCLVSPGMLLSISSSTSLQVLLSISSCQLVTKWSPSGHHVQAIVESSNANFNLTLPLTVHVHSAYQDFFKLLHSTDNDLEKSGKSGIKMWGKAPRPEWSLSPKCPLTIINSQDTLSQTRSSCHHCQMRVSDFFQVFLIFSKKQSYMIWHKYLIGCYCTRISFV